MVDNYKLVEYPKQLGGTVLSFPSTICQGDKDCEEPEFKFCK